jgi:hypothetical protein
MLIKLPLRYTLGLLCLLGTVVRVFYAFHFEPWWLAPDQLAWEILLKNSGFEYYSLIHYPHEGGSILFSLMAKMLQFIPGFYALTIVTLLSDFLSRLLQLLLCYKLFGKGSAMLLGAWQIMAIPALLPWGTLSYGLHAVSAVFPFLFLYLLRPRKVSSKNQLALGVFLGLAVWFHYVNVLFLPIYILVLLVQENPLKNSFYTWISFACILLVHVFVRSNLDPGFHLQQFEASSVRGLFFQASLVETYQHLSSLWFGPLSRSLISGLRPPLPYLHLFWGGILLLGFIAAIFYSTQFKHQKIRTAILLVLFFFLVYSLSPFFEDSINVGSYVAYRHLMYVLPLLLSLTFYGLLQLKWRPFSISALLLIGFFASFQFLSADKSSYRAIRATGWVLGVKLGDRPKVLSKIIEHSQLPSDSLYQGVAWGTAYAIFNQTYSPNDPNIGTKSQQLYELLNQYPPKFSCDIGGGVLYAFSDQVRPMIKKQVTYKVLNREEMLYQLEDF